MQITILKELCTTLLILVALFVIVCIGTLGFIGSTNEPILMAVLLTIGPVLGGLILFFLGHLYQKIWSN